MWLDLLLFSITVLALGWAFDQRNIRIGAQRDLEAERAVSRTLGMLVRQLRSRLEEAQARLVEVGGMGSPAPRPERRVRREG